MPGGVEQVHNKFTIDYTYYMPQNSATARDEKNYNQKSTRIAMQLLFQTKETLRFTKYRLSVSKSYKRLLSKC